MTLQSVRISGGTQGLTPGGGGILVDNASLTLNRVFVTSNNAGGTMGGGISNYTGGSLIIKQSEISYNSATYGGAVYNRGALYIENSLLYSNSGTLAGGALDNSASAPLTATIVNTTIASNTSSGGAGIANSGLLTLLQSTMANNLGSAGLILNAASNATIGNSILARHFDGPNCVRLTDTAVFNTYGYNLVDSGVAVPEGQYACPWSAGDKTNTDPQLTNALGYYDSFTETYGFVKNGTTFSPAIDAIPVGNAYCPSVDQRLHGRWADGNEDGVARCDIGAYEEGGVLVRLYMPIARR